MSAEARLDTVLMILEAFRTLDAQGCAMRCWARAVEWANWPAFVSQPFIPILYFFYSWPLVLGAVVGLNLLWVPLRTRVISLPLAVLGMLFARLKWLTMLIAVFVFARSNAWFQVILSLATPLVPVFLIWLTPDKHNSAQKISKYCMLQLGYVDREYEDPEYRRYVTSRGL